MQLAYSQSQSVISVFNRSKCKRDKWGKEDDNRNGRAHTFVAKDNRNVVGRQIGLGLDANQKGTASTSDHTLAWKVLALQCNCESSFLHTSCNGKLTSQQAIYNALTSC